MAAAGAAGPALFKEQPAPDNEDSNVSSPLSDVEDADPDDTSLEGLGLDRASPPNEAAGDDSDSDSNLSEANDTEAETERLFDTPQAQRQKDVVVGPNTDEPVFEQTPSKLAKTFSVNEDDADDGDNDSLSDNDDVSMTSSHPGDDEDADDDAAATSPAKIKKSTELSSADDTQESIESKKRKRSPAAEQSDAEQPLRKRTGSVAAKDAANGQDTPAAHDDDALSTHPNSGHQSGAEELAPAPVVIPKPSRDTASASPVKEPHSHKVTRSGSKRRSDDDDDDEAGDADAEADVDVDTHEEATADEEADHRADDDPNEHEDDAEAAARNAEELERKQAALEEWTDLEAKFSLFRDRLYKDRLEKLEAEEQSLQSENPTHAEYLLMKACVDERLEKRLAEINKEHELMIEAMDRLAVARRAQIWGQFYQGVREKREQFLEKLNHDWYDTQNARRSAHSVPDYGIQFPALPAQRTRNAVAYNAEVSYLSGLAKHEGFPAVPEMRGASAAEMEEDFEAFKRASRPPPPQPSVMPPIEEFQAASYGSGLGPAGEQFIKNTPWANPNHVSHKMQTVPLQSESGPSAAMPAALPATKPAAGPSRKNGHPVPKNSPTMAEASPETLRTATMLSQGVTRKRNGSLGVVGRGTKTPSQEAPKPDAAVAVS